MAGGVSRRDLIGITGSALGGLALAGTAKAGGAKARPLPPKGKIAVAIVVDAYTNLMDTASVWEPFLAAGLPGAPPFKPEQQLFYLFTVGEHAAPYETSGNMPGPNGFIFTPHFTFADAPQPQILVYPSQMGGGPAKEAWVRKVEPEAEVMMGICLGASYFAALGLLDGKEAASHHAFIDDFAKEYPNVRWQRGRRFVDQGKYVTSGGYTSGLDAALHVIARYHGEAVAERAAKWLEHDGDGWRTGVRELA